MKGVYYALVLTIRNPGKILNCKSKTKQRECPVGVLYTYLNYAVQPMVYPYTISLVAVYRCVIHIGVGLRHCSFRLIGQFPGASNREASDNAGLHAFFYVFTRSGINEKHGLPES